MKKLIDGVLQRIVMVFGCFFLMILSFFSPWRAFVVILYVIDNLENERYERLTKK